VQNNVPTPAPTP